MPSQLAQDLSPFYVMEVLERAKHLESAGKDIVHFEVGEPDFETPKEICETAIASLKKGETKYTSSLGLNELRESVAGNYNNNYGLNISHNNVVVTSGSSPALTSF